MATATVDTRFTGLPLEIALTELYEELVDVRDGELASYIPPLAEANPDWFGLAVVTVDGHCYLMGDVDVSFTIQSVSKPFVFGLALDDLGIDAVQARVGVEPTGDAFNSITVDQASGRPFNPMVNAGAIVTTSLVEGVDEADRWYRVLHGLSTFAGRPLRVDDEVYEAERATGDRNRAIAYLMRAFDMLRGDVEIALDAYFRQCSVLVDLRDLAMMGATLANNGVHPLTGEVALTPPHVARVLSVMSTCGMYDYAGEWLYRIGLPAKSGVSGGIVAVLPEVLAIASFSPPLDERGNSVRGIRACEALADRFRLHVFDARASAPVVRRHFDASLVRSKRRREIAQSDALRAAGDRVRILEVQGPLHFGSAESLSREVAHTSVGASHLVLDLTRVTSIDHGALPVIDQMLRSLVEHGVVVGAVGEHADELDRFAVIVTFATIDDALEHCENDVLAALGWTTSPDHFELAEHELLDGFGSEALAIISDAMHVERFPSGTRVVHEGDAADSVYFLVSGSVRVGHEVHGRDERLATIGPGGSFGEMAAIDGGLRSTNVDVEVGAVCHVLTVDAIAHLDTVVPGFSATFHKNIATTLSRRLRDANEALRALQA